MTKTRTIAIAVFAILVATIVLYEVLRSYGNYDFWFILHLFSMALAALLGFLIREDKHERAMKRAWMERRYLLNCACGRTVAVDSGQAGTAVTCECGATLDVPPLRQLFLRTSASTESARPGSKRCPTEK